MGQQLASKPTFTKQIEKLNPGATGDMLLKLPPPIFTIHKREF